VFLGPFTVVPIMETDHEKAQYAWDYRWCSVIDCGALLSSMVAEECGAIV